MQLRLVTVSLDPETGRFPEDPLAEIDGEVLNVVEHFFHHEGVPHLLLVVHERPREPGWAASRTRQSGHTPAHELDPGERALFEKLRAWRRVRAEADGVPVYVVMTNRHLADVARAVPRSLEALRKISGIGEGKSARYGREVLEVVAQCAAGGDVRGTAVAKASGDA